MQLFRRIPNINSRSFCPPLPLPAATPHWLHYSCTAAQQRYFGSCQQAAKQWDISGSYQVTVASRSDYTHYHEINRMRGPLVSITLSLCTHPKPAAKLRVATLHSQQCKTNTSTEEVLREQWNPGSVLITRGASSIPNCSQAEFLPARHRGPRLAKYGPTIRTSRPVFWPVFVATRPGAWTLSGSCWTRSEIPHPRDSPLCMQDRCHPVHASTSAFHMGKSPAAACTWALWAPNCLTSMPLPPCPAVRPFSDYRPFLQEDPQKSSCALALPSWVLIAAHTGTTPPYVQTSRCEKT